MIILIGGTGFIGKHLCVAMQEKGIEGACYSKNPDRQFLQDHCPDIRAIEIDNLLQAESRAIISKARAVIYLASNSYPAKKNNSALLEIDNNLNPAIKTLEAILDINNQLRVVYLSSGGTVYGSGHNHPIPEHTVLKPETPYAFGKIAMEQYLQLKANTSPASFTILRASNPVGQWHANLKQGFIGASISRVLHNESVRIFGDGHVIRDYIDADELAAGILLAIDRMDESGNRIWNIGSGVGTSLNDIVRDLAKVSGREIDVQYSEARNSDLEYNVLDCRKIQAELGWTAQTGIHEIVAKAWNEMSQN